MDKKSWENSLKLLEGLLKKKNEELLRLNKDIEEIEYTILCYKQKISEFKK
ncbi:MAG: hypothetical protein WC346_12425 [Methanogenium sp.]|jgi:hypothetical protein